MSFPYTFPFVFDGAIFLTVAESGTGGDVAVLNASFASNESGAGSDSGTMSNIFFVNDEGYSVETLKSLVVKQGSDLRLQHQPGQVSVAHKEVNL